MKKGGIASIFKKMLDRLGIYTSNDTTDAADDAHADKNIIHNKESFFSPLSKSILQSAELFDTQISFDSKYDLDAILTHTFAIQTNPSIFPPNDILSSCGPNWVKPTQQQQQQHYLDGNSQLNYNALSSMIKYCDMGIDRTPIQPDHEHLVRVPYARSLPCHFHTREGVRVTSLRQLADLAREVKTKTTKSVQGTCKVDDHHDKDEKTKDQTCLTTTTSSSRNDNESDRKELHLYAVSAGRVFMFAPKYVGEIFELPHVKGPEGLPVSLEVMSLNPRVFDIYNFFDRSESAAIVDKALKETTETHRMKRSTTGASSHSLNSKRTSENGFDTHGKEAMIVKHRCMDILGFDEYVESLTDGLQVLRYNKTTGYYSHMDWIDDHYKKEEHNYDSAGVGSNRFATILLYMSDLKEGDGGETLFSHGWPIGQPEEDHVPLNVALETLRESGDVEGILKRDSWEEKMVANCRTRLAVRPHSSRAVLFYSQHPDGSVDDSSLHGGCPVIKGEKWAANLWVWNAPRNGFPGSPKNQHVVEKNRAANKSPEHDVQKHATFYNTKSDESMRNAQLFFQDTFWGLYGFDDPPLGVNTFEGHKWYVRVDGEVVKSFIIGKEKNQEFNI